MAKKKQVVEEDIDEAVEIELTPEQQVLHVATVQEFDGKMRQTDCSGWFRGWDAWPFETSQAVRVILYDAFNKAREVAGLHHVEFGGYAYDRSESQAQRAEHQEEQARWAKERAARKARAKTKTVAEHSTVVKQWSKEMSDIAARLEEIAGEMESEYEEKSEGWQEGERGCELQEYIQRLGSVAEELKS